MRLAMLIPVKMLSNDKNSTGLGDTLYFSDKISDLIPGKSPELSFGVKTISVSKKFGLFSKNEPRVDKFGLTRKVILLRQNNFL